MSHKYFAKEKLLKYYYDDDNERVIASNIICTFINNQPYE